MPAMMSYFWMLLTFAVVIGVLKFLGSQFPKLQTLPVIGAAF